MKKSVVLLLGILIGVGASYLYFNREVPAKVSEEATMAKAIAKPKGVITPTQAKVLDANWTKTRKRAVDSAAGRPDNRSSWWSLKDMRDYLNYAENQTKELGYTMNGVRIYLGVYGGKAPNGKADYSTMFLIPTGRKSVSQGSMINLALQGGDKDIPEGDALNDGTGGVPPGSDYPQQ